MMRNNISKTFKLSIAALAVTTVLTMTSASADDLVGTIIDSQSKTAGYTVKAVNLATGTQRTVSVNEDGSYRLAKMPSGNYKITVMRNGVVVAEDNARASLGTNAVTNFEITAVDDTEVIEVVGSSVSTIDLASSDSGLTIGDVEIARMPIAQNITSVALLAPGTVKGDSAFGNSASFGGSSVAENACYINGLEVTNTRQGLGCGEVPFEFYKEFQIKTGGYSARYGRATGGTMNSVTKSGTNDWEFVAIAQFQPDSLEMAGSTSRGKQGSGAIFRDGSLDKNNKTDFTISAGGPIIEDTLFFYGLLNPRDTESTYTWGGDEFSPNDQYRVEKASSGDNLFWGAKVDWDINEDHRLSLFGYSNRRDIERSVFDYSNGVVGDRKDGAILKRGGEAKSLSYTGYMTDDLIVTALVGNIETEYETESENLICPSVTDSRTTDSPIKGCGAGGSFGANNDENTQFRLDVEYNFGDHTFAVGYDYQERKSANFSSPIGGHSYDYKTLAVGGDFQADSGALENTGTAAFDYVEDRIFDGGGKFESELAAYYIEDKWQVTEDIILDIGIRVDEFDSWGTTGKLLTSFKTDIAPRLGITWDPTGTGESKVYATYGRYYLPVANNTIFRAASGVDDATTAYTYSGVDASTGAPTGLAPLADSANINNGTSSGAADSRQVSGTPIIPEKAIFQGEEADPFSKDEYIIGYEQILNDEYTIGFKGTYREVATALDDYCGRYAYPNCVMINPGDAATWYKDGLYWTGTEWDLADGVTNKWDDPRYDGVPDAGSKQTYSAETIGLPKANNEYTSIESMVKYHADSVNYTLVYTWSRSVGNFEGAVKSDIGQADAGITQDFDFPALMDGADGYQPNDRRHVIKFFGTWEPMENLLLGWNSTLSSGRPVSLFGQGYPSDDPNLNGGWGDLFYLANTDEDGELTGEYTRHTRGSAGRTPWTFNVDLSAAYSFTVSDVDMRASFSIFNVLNSQVETSANEHYESSEGVVNQWHGAAYGFQTPRSARISFEARF